MKHTNVYKIIKSIKQIEYNELESALRAHGGSYSKEELGWVMVNTDSGPCDARIDSIRLDKKRGVEFVAYDPLSGEYLNINFNDIAPGYVSDLIDEIPETDEIKDVTTYKNIWDLDEAINLQYITLQLEDLFETIYGSSWLSYFGACQKLAIEFSEIEAKNDWDGEEYEENIYQFCEDKRKEILHLK